MMKARGAFLEELILSPLPSAVACHRVPGLNWSSIARKWPDTAREQNVQSEWDKKCRVDVCLIDVDLFNI